VKFFISWADKSFQCALWSMILIGVLHIAKAFIVFLSKI